MLFKFPKNDKQFIWTSHVKRKMLQYRLSDQKIKLILNNPARTETGIAPRTVAKMKRNDTPKRREELWVMYQEMTSDTRHVTSDKKPKTKNLRQPKRLKIISAWRYPGVSPKRNIPIPDDTLEELTKNDN